MAVLLVLALLTLTSGLPQAGFTARDLADYRLTAGVFERFRQASRSVTLIASRDPVFEAAPLFAQEIVQGGEVTEVATALERRLLSHDELSSALRAASMPAREYTMFVLSLVAARLALGFLESGVLKAVPPGVTAENVAFVRAHHEEIDAVLNDLGIEIK